MVDNHPFVNEDDEANSLINSEQKKRITEILNESTRRNFPGTIFYFQSNVFMKQNLVFAWRISLLVPIEC